MTKYNYYSISPLGKRKAQYFSYTDIACEFGVTKNVIAGKFYRAHKSNSNIIRVGKTDIEKVKDGE